MGAGVSAIRNDSSRRRGSIDSESNSMKTASLRRSSFSDCFDLFADADTVAELEALRFDKIARSSYAVYIKSGLWVDKLKVFETEQLNSCQLMQDLNQPATDYLWKSMGYRFAESFPKIIKASQNIDSLPCDRGYTKKSRSYANIHSEVCFSISDLTSILLVGLYPVYRRSRYHLRYRQFREEHRSRQQRTDSDDVVPFDLHEEVGEEDDDGFETSDEDAYNGSEGCLTENVVSSPLEEPDSGCGSNRLRSILLSVAAFHDQDRLVEILADNNIVNDCMGALSRCPLPVAISSVQKIPGQCGDRDFADGSLRFGGAAVPIIYANNTFRKLTGYSVESKSLSLVRNRVMSMNSLFGKSTEMIQQQRIDFAVHTATAAKLMVTCHRRSGFSFLTAVAMRPLKKMTSSFGEVTNYDTSDVSKTLPQIVRKPSQLQGTDYQYMLHIMCDASRPQKALVAQDMEDLQALLPFMIGCVTAVPQDYHNLSSSASTSVKSQNSPGARVDTHTTEGSFKISDRKARVSNASMTTEIL